MAREYEEDPSAPEHIAQMAGRLVEAVAKAIVPDAKRYVPVLTSYLRNHIEAHRVTDDHWRVVADAEYAAAVEAGHTTRAGTHVAAQPYLRPAAYKNRDFR